jgi:hypothetical protein
LKEEALDRTLENSLWKRLRTCRKTDCRMKRLRTCRKTDCRMKRLRTCRKTDYRMKRLRACRKTDCRMKCLWRYNRVRLHMARNAQPRHHAVMSIGTLKTHVSSKTTRILKNEQQDPPKRQYVSTKHGATLQMTVIFELTPARPCSITYKLLWYWETEKSPHHFDTCKYCVTAVCVGYISGNLYTPCTNKRNCVCCMIRPS